LPKARIFFFNFDYWEKTCQQYRFNICQKITKIDLSESSGCRRQYNEMLAHPSEKHFVADLFEKSVLRPP
jgi:hypothetical protein